jgi:hypothetical protein
MKNQTPMRWRINRAASEFRIDDETLSKRLKALGVTPGPDGMFCTYDIARAATGDLQRERIRETRHRANLLQLQEGKARGEMLDAEAVCQVWASYLVHVRQIVRHSELSEARKRDILEQLKTIPAAEYFEGNKQPDELRPDTE